jgi:hypothetical protein
MTTNLTKSTGLVGSTLGGSPTPATITNANKNTGMVGSSTAVETGYLLLESASRLLLETGDSILIAGTGSGVLSWSNLAKN